MVRLEHDPTGLQLAEVSNDHCDAQVYLQGAHVTHWKPKGHQPVLFLSSRSHFKPGVAIRGGIPVILPWFGPRSDGQPGPAHGWARTALWTLEDSDKSSVLLTLPEKDGLRAAYRIGFESALTLELAVENTSASHQSFQNALHTYFEVADVRQCSVTGVENATYLDKTDGFARKTAPDGPFHFERETDNVFNRTAATCEIHDPGNRRRIRILKTGSNSTIVWNPWGPRTATIADMGPDDWTRMLCVESGNVGSDAITLAPGARHVMEVEITVTSDE